jgi:antitoxin ParD1/3/4
MSSPMTLNVRVTGPLSEFVDANVGADGPYGNVSEYVRDLIRKERDRAELAAVERLKAELAVAFAVADDVIVTVQHERMHRIERFSEDRG